jgi:hypothetical protein
MLMPAFLGQIWRKPLDGTQDLLDERWAEFAQAEFRLRAAVRGRVEAGAD